MSARQRRVRVQLILGSILGVLCFGFLAYAFSTGSADVDGSGALTLLWWGSGLAAIAFAVAACNVDRDSEDPRYLRSIVAGLRDEWRH